MDAIGIWAYSGPLLQHTVDGLVAHTSPDVPIYILDHAPPGQDAQKAFVRQIAERHGKRVHVEECFVYRGRMHSPLSIVLFLEKHPEIERLLKIDDDFFVVSDVYSGCVAAYESRTNTLFSVPINPINIWGLSILRDRLGWGNALPDAIYNPEGIYQFIVENPDVICSIWNLLFGNGDFREVLRIEPRYIEIPPTRRTWGMCTYFAHRDDILAVGGKRDEVVWHKRWLATGRPRLMDTWTVALHGYWFAWASYFLETVYPTIAERIKPYEVV